MQAFQSFNYKYRNVNSEKKHKMHTIVPKFFKRNLVQGIYKLIDQFSLMT